MMENRKIIFVYNADSSLEHRLFDFLHKAISPATYQCSLCGITHGTFRMKQAWKDFIKGLGVPVEILYKNEFRRYYRGIQTSYPVILQQTPQGLEVLVSTQELAGLDLAGLQQVLELRAPAKMGKRKGSE